MSSSSKRRDDGEEESSPKKQKVERRKSRFQPKRSSSSEEEEEEESSNGEDSQEVEEVVDEKKENGDDDEMTDSDESETEPFVKEKGMIITKFKNRLHDVRSGIPFVPSSRFVTKERKVNDLDDGGAFQRDLDRMENGLYVPRKPEVTKSNLNARGHRDRREGGLSIELPSHPLESRGRVTLLEDTDEEDDDDIHCKVVSRKLYRSKNPISSAGGITVAHSDAVLVRSFTLEHTRTSLSLSLSQKRCRHKHTHILICLVSLDSLLDTQTFYQILELDHVQFDDQPFQSLEERLASALRRMYESYDERVNRTHQLASLWERLKNTKSVRSLFEWMEEVTQIRTETTRIYSTWKKLKRLREKQKYNSTTTRVVAKRVKLFDRDIVRDILDDMAERFNNQADQQDDENEEKTSNSSEREKWYRVVSNARRAIANDRDYVVILTDDLSYTPSTSETLPSSEVQRRETLSKQLYRVAIRVNDSVVDRGEILKLRWPSCVLKLDRVVKFHVVKRPKSVYLDIFRCGKVFDRVLGTVVIEPPGNDNSDTLRTSLSLFLSNVSRTHSYTQLTQVRPRLYLPHKVDFVSLLKNHLMKTRTRKMLKRCRKKIPKVEIGFVSGIHVVRSIFPCFGRFDQKHPIRRMILDSYRVL